MNLIQREKERRARLDSLKAVMCMRPSTVREPDRTTWYCDIATRKFQIGCCKILMHYANGDCTVLAPNGVQFTAKAEEIYNMRKGDYHEQHSL